MILVAPGFCVYRSKGQSSDQPALDVYTEKTGTALSSHSRYPLLDTARRLLGPSFSRLWLCQRLILPRPGADVAAEIVRSSLSGEHRYHNLMSCRSPWVCPVCAPAIWSYRQEELEQAFAAHQANGGEQLFITLTVQHRYLPLGLLLENLIRARSLFYDDGAVRRMRKELGDIGQMNVLEVRWGQEHGWHAHLHLVWNCAPGFSVYRSKAQQTIAAAWERAAGRVNLRAGHSRAVDVRDGDGNLAAYLTKSGLVGSGPDLAGQTSYSCWDLLRIAGGQAVTPSVTPELAGSLFRQYALATVGHHSLRWSPGLRAKLLGAAKPIEEPVAGSVEDEQPEEAVDTEPSDTLVARILTPAWLVVLGNGCRGELLEVADRGGIDGLIAACDALSLSYQRKDGVLVVTGPSG